jgi:phosphoesterase RecJ-like protein
MSMKNSYLDSILEGKTSVAISGHVRPDGDCVGSTLAVYNYIRTYYPQIQVKIFLEPFPNIFKFMQYSDEIDSNYSYDGTFDLFIALDCGDLGRLGKAADYFTSAAHTLCIDHHVSNQAFAEENYIFPDASATCELVFELMDRERITKEIAECLYTGIVHDTGVFQYSCTSKKTMAVAGELMEMGIDYTKIVDDTFYTKTFAQNQILGQALLNSRLYLDGACIVSAISRAEMEKYNVLPKHLEGIVNQLRVTKGVRVALFLYENEDGTWKGSLRVNGEFNVAEVAQCFGGGGHVKAAGFTIEGPVDTAIERVLSEIKKRL